MVFKNTLKHEILHGINHVKSQRKKVTTARNIDVNGNSNIKPSTMHLKQLRCTSKDLRQYTHCMKTVTEMGRVKWSNKYYSLARKITDKDKRKQEHQKW